MSNKKSVFIDTNIIARWVLFSSLLNEKETEKERQEFILENKKGNSKANKLYTSYFFMEDVVLKKKTKFNFVYSNLVITELINVLFENYVASYMQRNFIPLSDIHTIRKTFSKGTYDELSTKYGNYLDKLKKYLSLIDVAKVDIGMMSGLFLTEFGLLNHDALIVAQAVYWECPYLITNDTELIDRFKKENKTTKIIRPETFLKDVLKISHQSSE